MTREKSPTRVTIKKRAPPKLKSAQPEYTAFVDPEQRAALISVAAYFRAEKRGFAAGHEAEDWLAAEGEVDASLLGAESAPRV
jgi:hypothetical protein